MAALPRILPALGLLLSSVTLPALSGQERSPAVKVPVESVPAGRAPAVKVPVESVPGGLPPAVKVPVENVPPGRAPAVRVPVESVPAGRAPAVRVPVVNVPVVRVPVQDVPRTVTPARPRIQIAILLDTSSSMQGLIDQAKRELWKIVNQFARAERDGERPVFEVALYEYGRNTLPAPHIRKVSPLTSDLDRVYEGLFQLEATTKSGSNEYHPLAIQTAALELSWSPSNEDLKTIYVAGNESFFQGPVDYRTACKTAVGRGITVNTVFCGSQQAGIASGWRDGALVSDGDFLTIDQNLVRPVIQTPQDAPLLKLNDRLNRTYVPYGRDGLSARRRQEDQDANASSLGRETAVRRAAVKGSSLYQNSSWDLVDAIKSGKVKLEALKDEDLPAALRKLNPEERKNYLEGKAAERTEIRNRIRELANQRDKYVESEEARRLQAGSAPAGEEPPEPQALDSALIDSLKRQATRKNYSLDGGKTPPEKPGAPKAKKPGGDRTAGAGEATFVDLFDGKTLDGFEQKGGRAKYSVEDGCIVGTTVPGTPNSFLCTKKHYGDFILEYEFKVDEQLNSGVQIRSNSFPEYRDGRVHGYQVEIDPDVKRNRMWTAGIYDEGRRGWLNDLTENEAARKAFRPDQWNAVRVEAIGPSIKTWLNGVAAADLVDSMTLSGFIALQVHGIGNREGSFHVRWRNLRIADLGRHVWKPLFDGETLKGWHPVGGGEWKVEKGSIVARNQKSQPRHGHLILNEPKKDFTIRLKYRAVKGNSGLYFRSEEVPGNVGIAGFQAEIDATKDAGGLYETGGRAWVVQPRPEAVEKYFHPGEWNQMTVSARGRRITVHVNGTRTAELRDDPGRAEGLIALQLHGGQDVEVRFRDIEILAKG